MLIINSKYLTFKFNKHSVSLQVVSSVKWLEDELELNALHNPGSRRGSGNEKAAVTQRTALSAALGGRVEVAAMSSISGLVNSLIFICEQVELSVL